MRKDRLRQERERLWEEAHQQYLDQHGDLHDLDQSDCIVCEATKQFEQPYAKSNKPPATAWWEREGGLVADHILVPRTPPRRTTISRRLSAPHLRPSSELSEFIRSYRDMRNVTDTQRQQWEDRCKLDTAIRKKYDLSDEFDIDTEFLSLPLPASHAKFHYQRSRDDLFAAERRANRYERRAKDYKPSRSSLTVSELAEDIILGDDEVEILRLADEAADLQRRINMVATEVGYLYFVGPVGMLEAWRDDVDKSKVSLVYRRYDMDMEMGQLDEDCEMAENNADQDEAEEEL